LITILLMVVSIYFLIFAWRNVSHLDNPIAIYWLDSNNIALRPLLACVLLPCILLICVLRRVLRKTMARSLLVALVGTNIIAVLALPPCILCDYREQASVEFNNHIYYALSSVGISGIEMIVYECEKSVSICRKIYRNYEGNSHLSGQTRLLPDPATNTLALEINGEVVYTHHS
jgi:hypothetical protein